MWKVAEIVTLVLLLLGGRAFATEEYAQGLTGGDVNYLVLRSGAGETQGPTGPSDDWLGLSQGWWSSTYHNGDENDNHFVGSTGGNVLRNFFTFDLAGVGPGTVVSAVLRLTVGSGDSSDPSRTTQPYSFWDVTTDPITLNRNDDTSAAIFGDLGAGMPYGFADFPLARASVGPSTSP